jgi:hypothetical protein
MPLGIQIACTFVLGGGLGLLVGWLMGRNRISSAPADLRWENEWRRHLAQREAEVVAKRDQLTQSMTSLATALTNETKARRSAGDQKLITPIWHPPDSGDGISPRFPAEAEAISENSRLAENRILVEDRPALAAEGHGKPFAEIK